MGAMTVQSFQVKTDEQGNPKKDNFGNTQMMIKFAESPETVYKAVKDPSTMTEGKVMYGSIIEGQYGFKFQADPYNQPGQAPSQPFSSPSAPVQAPLPVADNETKELLLAIYEAITGEKYTGVQKETTSVETPATVSPDISDDELAEVGF